MVPKLEFDAALSFAGEDRKIVEEIAFELKKRNLKIFYDEFYQVTIWGKDLSKYFEEAYAKNTKFVIIFISKHYPLKDWTNFEFEIARGEAKQRKEEFILPIRLDDTPLFGLKPTVGYLDYKEGKEKIIDIIEKKLKTSKSFTENQIRNKRNIHISKELELQMLQFWTLKSKTRWQQLIKEKLPDKKQTPFQYGAWYVAYSIIGNFEPLSLKNLLEILEKIELEGSSWPPWKISPIAEFRPHPYEEHIESWLYGLDEDPRHSDFWRASPKGKMFLLQGYFEDSSSEIKPGSTFDITFPIHRITECLLHSYRFTKKLSPDSREIAFSITWEGLKNRKIAHVHLDAIASPFIPHTAHQDSITSNLIINITNKSQKLIEILMKLFSPLCEIFEFYQLAFDEVKEEVSSVLKSNT